MRTLFQLCGVFSLVARWAMLLSQEIRWLGIDIPVDVRGQGNFIRRCGFGYQADRRRQKLFRLMSWFLCSGTTRGRSFCPSGA